MNYTKETAFTLAEVLIVLAIIGVVAAVTIPALMQSTQDQEFKSVWKKEFSALSQATLRLSADNGGDISNFFPVSGQTATSYANYFNASKSCAINNYACFTDFSNIKKIDGTLFSSYCSNGKYMLDDGAFILNDGALIAFESSSTQPTYDRYIFVDVNGFKQPNTVGKDIFGVRLLNNKIIPLGTSGAVNTSGMACFVDSTTGFDNSAKYLNK